MLAMPITFHDWQAFQGAEEFPSGERPLWVEGFFADGTRYTVIINHEGSTLTVKGHEQSDAGGWVADFPVKTAKQAAALLLAMGEPESLDDFLAWGYNPA